jgi:hypothetical protein
MGTMGKNTLLVNAGNTLLAWISSLMRLKQFIHAK